jgi:hypothetical protein
VGALSKKKNGVGGTWERSKNEKGSSRPLAHLA